MVVDLPTENPNYGANLLPRNHPAPTVVSIDGYFAIQSLDLIVMEIGGTTQRKQYDHLFFPAGVVEVSYTTLRPRFINNFRSVQPITGNFVNFFGGRVNAADGTGSFAVSFTTGNTRRAERLQVRDYRHRQRRHAGCVRTAVLRQPDGHSV